MAVAAAALPDSRFSGEESILPLGAPPVAADPARASVDPDADSPPAVRVRVLGPLVEAFFGTSII
jgi:hypothetical protein